MIMLRGLIMKHLVLSSLVFGFLTVEAVPAAAIVCEKDIYRGGCAGTHHAAAARRPVAPVGVAPPVYTKPVDARPEGVLVCSYHAMGERVCE